mmetsp:Transcript_95360/g.269882  ORF Transcript_95360/g.269882 Transcript_95360/m.269882 type:complete len:200 (-) Transcript_95360:572-1171(-)
MSLHLASSLRPSELKPSECSRDSNDIRSPGVTSESCPEVGDVADIFSRSVDRLAERSANSKPRKLSFVRLRSSSARTNFPVAFMMPSTSSISASTTLCVVRIALTMTTKWSGVKTATNQCRQQKAISVTMVLKLLAEMVPSSSPRCHDRSSTGAASPVISIRAQDSRTRSMPLKNTLENSARNLEGYASMSEATNIDGR